MSIDAAEVLAKGFIYGCALIAIGLTWNGWGRS